jgi:hypothetical protein
LESVEELQGFLTAVTPQGFRGRLLPIGEARAIIRRDGELPEDAPQFRIELDTDLKDYGFSLLRASLAYYEAAGASDLGRLRFYRAGEAFEAVIRNGFPDAPDRGFLRIMAAASFHLASYSALAYSILSVPGGQNFSPIENALAMLMLRDLSNLRRTARAWLFDADHSDESIAEDLTDGAIDRDEAVALIISSTVFRGLAYFDFALATGDGQSRGEALELLHRRWSWRVLQALCRSGGLRALQ